MSEQIREQVSAFLDGELPSSETELLLKRLTRDGELRESFGRYALIGEAMRGSGSQILTQSFASRVNLAIDGEPPAAPIAVSAVRERRWWRPLAGVSVAAGVAAVAIVALQQRAISPGSAASTPNTATNLPAPAAATVAKNQSAVQGGGGPREALSYTVPPNSDQTMVIAPARLTNYVFAHSKYSSGLGQRGLLTDLLIEDDQPEPQPAVRPQQPQTPEARIAP
jgi:sigma-E factor negative regulatory protein RseA